MSKNRMKYLRPEGLDAKMDLLDLIKADSPEERLPIIAGVEYCRPVSMAETLREEFGDGHAGCPLAR